MRGDSTAARAAIVEDLSSEALERFEALRQWRAGVAREQGVPAYVIFHDSTLRQIAIVQPTDLDALTSVNGVGASKLERYGQAVLEALSSSPA